MTTIPTGLDHTPEPVAGVRTSAQLAAVQAVMARPAFCHALSNPFVPEVEDYTGPFGFIWADHAKVIHLTRVGSAGQVIREVTSA